MNKLPLELLFAAYSKATEYQLPLENEEKYVRDRIVWTLMLAFFEGLYYAKNNPEKHDL